MSAPVQKSAPSTSAGAAEEVRNAVRAIIGPGFHVRLAELDIASIIDRHAAPAPGQQAGPSAPTDLSKQLRDIAAPIGNGQYVQVRPQMLNAAAEEIDRYYGGMLAWKKTAEAKDVAPTAVQPAAPSAPTEDMDLHQLAEIFLYSAQLGAPLTISAKSCGLLFDAMTTPDAAAAQPVGLIDQAGVVRLLGVFVDALDGKRAANESGEPGFEFNDAIWANLEPARAVILAAKGGAA